MNEALQKRPNYSNRFSALSRRWTIGTISLQDARILLLTNPSRFDFPRSVYHMRVLKPHARLGAGVPAIFEVFFTDSAHLPP